MKLIVNENAVQYAIEALSSHKDLNQLEAVERFALGEMVKVMIAYYLEGVEKDYLKQKEDKKVFH